MAYFLVSCTQQAMEGSGVPRWPIADAACRGRSHAELWPSVSVMTTVECQGREALGEEDKGHVRCSSRSGWLSTVQGAFG